MESLVAFSQHPPTQGYSQHTLTHTIKSLSYQLETQHWKGTMPSVAYDTAWVAALQTETGQSVFPSAINWLLQHQSSDGSWGGTVPFYCDRLLTTTAVVGTLIQYPQFEKEMTAGLDWITTHLPALKNGLSVETAGFEFLFPAMLQRLKKYEIDLGEIGHYLLKKQEVKLAKAPLELVLQKHSARDYTLEFLAGQEHMMPNLDHLLTRNGSIATSPSTTAWYYPYANTKKQPQMLHYLRQTQQADGGWPSFADYTFYNTVFALYPLEKVGYHLPNSHKILHELVLSKFRSKGIGWSEAYPICDADDTAVALYLGTQYKLLAASDPRWQSLSHYRRSDSYETFPHETGYSNMVNLHVLDALVHRHNAKDEPDIDMLLRFFEQQITSSHTALGRDKYHYSPYFQNCHGILTLAQLHPTLAIRLRDWFLDQQQPNGCWGSQPQQITVEETAYAVLGLTYSHQHLEPLDLTLLEPAVHYLLTHYPTEYPTFWLSKVLYTPIEIIQAHILAALFNYWNLNF